MPEQDPELTPEQEARVRRLLAEARPHPTRDALPPEVATRLDATLTALVEDPTTAPLGAAPAGTAEGSTAGAVTVLAARRRRHVGGLLLAAAAVVVAAVGIGQVADFDGGTSGSDAGGTAAVDSGEGADRGAVSGSAESLDDGGAAEEVAPTPMTEPGAGLAAPQDESSSSDRLQAVTRVRVRVQQFSRDSADIRAALTSTPVRDEYAAPSPARLPAILRTRQVFECGSTDLGSGTWVAVVYDRAPGVLVFRRSAGDTQVVELVQCGTGEILRSTTLPARPRS